MTSGNDIKNDIKTVAYKGVTCKADMGLYRNEGHGSNCVYLLSVYGAQQQVKAVASAIVTGSVVNTGDMRLTRGRNAMRFKITSLGNGKSNGLLWIEDIQEHVIWTEPSEEMKALDAALSRRRVPYDKGWLTDIQRLLIENGYLTSLEGWGGVQGYHAFWDDNAICDLLSKNLVNLKAA